MMLCQWYLHLVEDIFSCVRDVECSIEFESYAADILAPGRATHSGQVFSEMQGKEREPCSPGRGLGLGLSSISHGSSIIFKPQQQGGHVPRRGSSVIEEKEEDCL
jgi:hypothetical protein